MLPANHIAFKEWAVICAALGAGRQAIILRKGGIDEGRAGFRVAHGEFWLFPTWFHEAQAKLTDEARPIVEQIASDQQPAGMIPFALYAVVTDVCEIRDEAILLPLQGRHIWSHQTVSERYHYRQPGLFAMVVRIHRLDEPRCIPDSPHFAGCRSWVELPAPVSTAGLHAVLTDDEFERERDRIRTALGAARIV